MRFVVVVDRRKNVLAYETSTLGWRNVRARGHLRDLDRIVADTADHCDSLTLTGVANDVRVLGRDEDF